MTTTPPIRTQWQLVRRRFLRHRLAVAGLTVLALLLVGCFGADWIAPFPRNAQDLALGPGMPSGAHWLGTDELGRDYFSEILFAGRISLAIGLSVAVLATALGTTLGALAGYFGGWIDEVVMRITDLFLVVPAIVVLALALQGFGKSPVTIVLVLAALFWTYVARVVRGQVLSLREKEYVAAAKVLGARNGRIVVRHILPNLTGVIAVNTSLGAAGAVIIESTLSFLGYGVQPPESSWGNMLSQASGLIGTDKVHLLYFPGLFILLTALAINFVGDGLRDALDPQGGQIVTLLEVDDLTVRFPTDDGLVTAVQGLSFRVDPGQTLGIVGESGSGKSITSMAILGILPRRAQVTGSIRFAGRELLGLSERELQPLRGNRIAMVFQDALTALNPVRTVGEQIAEAIRVHDSRPRRAELRKRAIELLDVVGIPSPATRTDQYPHELSGGMRQRVMIAMSIANEPELLIADEPTTALDVTVQAQIMDVVERIQDRTDSAILLVTHDLGVVAGVADRVLVMYAGTKVEEGPVEPIFYETAHPYTRGLLASLPRLDRRQTGELYRIPGQPPSPLHRPSGCAFHVRCTHALAGLCDVEIPVAALVGADHTAACLRLEEVRT